MKKIFICMVLIFISFRICAQEVPIKNYMNITINGPHHDLFINYPLVSDKTLNEAKSQAYFTIKYPILIVNNIVIRDSIQVDCFRNNYSQYIKKIKRLHYEEAVKKGFKNIPRDGAVLVTMKKNIYIDLYK